MSKRIISCLVSASMIASLGTGFAVTTAEAAAKTPVYQDNARQMEELNRGLIAVYRTADNRSVLSGEAGVYLSWRLFGTESLENQAFDIYRGTNGNYKKIKTTGVHDATNYIDTAGTVSNTYKVVKAGEDASKEPAVSVQASNYTAKGSEVGNGNSEKNSFTYVDIPISRPNPVSRMGDGKTSYYYTYDDHEGGANDASVGDLDGDGDYEIVLKWDPTDSKDSAGADYTGNVYIDGYEITTDTNNLMWRIDLGQNVTAGQHYTQFIVYDFDGDGRSEIAMKTAPGSIDGQGNYVSEAGDSAAIRNVDNTKSYVGTSGSSKGKNMGPEYLTVFDGETGAALATTDYIPLGKSSDWGDSKYNRAERFLAGVAYLDGVHPSMIMCRGYYERAVVRAYDWDGESLTLRWEHIGTSYDNSLFHSGAHSLSVADVDNDGKDEIVYCSAVLDDDGTGKANTRHGHGDALHVNDFNNDGVQEAFSVKEHKEGYANNAANFRVPNTGVTIWGRGAAGDTGRGVMANIDDEYASANANGLALAWSSSHDNLFDLAGNEVSAKPTAGSRTMTNFLVYWDGDLGREILDDTIIGKYHVSTGYMRRFYSSDGYSLTGASSNNYSKNTPSLVADLWGDWREEIIMPYNKSKDGQAYLRIFTSTLPTDYRLTTLMHDSQYRCAVAWQNVGYNQPPHQSYYIGSAALATDEGGNTLNYLAPSFAYTKVIYGSAEKVAVTGVEFEQSSVSVEKSRTEMLAARILPENATKRGVTWTSSDPDVATVERGAVTGVKPGNTTITVKTNDGGYTAQCNVTVWSTPVTGIAVSDSTLNLGVNMSKNISAQVEPENASVRDYAWSSSNNSVATVDTDGNIYGVSAGTAVISAVSAEGGYKAECIVSVLPMQSVDKTGSDVFKTDNTDSNTTLSGASASGGTLTQSGAAVGGNMYKTFEAVSDSKAELTFRFTTGGQRIDGVNWDWTDHEYSMNAALLDAEGNNILTLTQSYAEKAGTLMSKIGEDSAESFATSWTSAVDGIGNVQGSTKRWIVDIEFDYDNDSATATITGTDSTWESVLGKYTKEFGLNGLKLGMLSIYTTNNGSGTISTRPIVEGVSYTQQTMLDGRMNTVYERGTSSETAWTQADISDWSVTGAALNYSDANGYGRIYFDTTKPASAYSAVKSFTLNEHDELVTYDVDWYFGSAVNRAGNAEYIQFGDRLRLEWTKDYKLYVSVDGGGSYLGDPIFSGSNTVFTKHIQVTFDPAITSIKSLMFDGAEISGLNGYSFGEKTNIDSVTFGFKRIGATDNWNYPTGLDSICVVEFIGKDAPAQVTPTPGTTPTSAPSTTATPTAAPPIEDNVTVDLFGIDDDTQNSVTAAVTNNESKSVEIELIVAVYEDDGRLKSVRLDTKMIDANSSGSITVKNSDEGTLKAFLWNLSANNKPLKEKLTNMETK